MTVYRVFVDVKDPDNVLKGQELDGLVQGVISSAKVEITAAQKKAHVTVEACTRHNSNNTAIMGEGWHVHDGVTNGCPICKQGFADNVA